MSSLLIRGGRIIDPASGFDDTCDLLIIDGIITELGSFDATTEPDLEIDASNLCVIPGLIDVHVHFRDPGQTHKEDFTSGSNAALAGGFTSVIQMPNTIPPLASCDQIVRYTRKKPVNTYVAAAVTKNRAGREIIDLTELSEAGAVTFSDDGSPVCDDIIMEQALELSNKLQLRIMSHAENPDLSCDGVIVSGKVAEKFGVKGINPDAESSMVARDIELARKTGGNLHICHVSTRKTVDLIRKAKLDGIKISAEVTPHHLLLNHEAVLDYGSDAKMNPPLAYEEDRLACVEGLVDGTLDIIATDHAPHTPDEKALGLIDAPFGIIGLETSFALMYTHLVETGKLTLTKLIDKMSYIPTQLFTLPGGRIAENEHADITIVDLNAASVIDSGTFYSKSSNTPFNGWAVKGKIIYTIVNGDIRFPIS